MGRATGTGSSPRMRGKLRGCGSVSCGRRLIPAYAGKTARTPQSLHRAEAHPRVCGENSARQSRGIPCGGSSPRMRGKLGGKIVGPLAPRLIPAYAGKTICHCGIRSNSQAHPRVCGENIPASLPHTVFPGSSPRMRGKRSRRCRSIPSRRLIPAYAGKTAGVMGIMLMPWAHPRVCGENIMVIILACPPMGSSPRMRGKRTEASQAAASPRLIPAYAGKTTSPYSSWYASRAHPRVCGENAPNGVKNFADGGSSPRMRGKLLRAATGGRYRGLIPAYAGKTSGYPR